MIGLFIGLILIMVPWLLDSIDDGGFLGQPLHAAETASYQMDLMTKMIPAIGMDIIQEALEDQGLSDEAASQYQTLVMVDLFTPTPPLTALMSATPTLFRLTSTIEGDSGQQTATNQNPPTLIPSNTPWWPGGNRTRIPPSPTPIPEATRTPTSTSTPSPTFTPTPTRTYTPTFTLTPSLTPSFTPSLTATASATHLPSFTATSTPTEIVLASQTPSFTKEPTSTFTVGPTNTPVWTPSETPTLDITPTLTPTPVVNQAQFYDSHVKASILVDRQDGRIRNWLMIVRDSFRKLSIWTAKLH